MKRMQLPRVFPGILREIAFDLSPPPGCRIPVWKFIGCATPRALGFPDITLLNYERLGEESAEFWIGGEGDFDPIVLSLINLKNRKADNSMEKNERSRVCRVRLSSPGDLTRDDPYLAMCLQYVLGEDFGSIKDAIVRKMWVQFSINEFQFETYRMRRKNGVLLASEVGSLEKIEHAAISGDASKHSSVVASQSTSSVCIDCYMQPNARAGDLEKVPSPLGDIGFSLRANKVLRTRSKNALPSVDSDENCKTWWKPNHYWTQAMKGIARSRMLG